ncbi:transcription termination factor Rho [Modestobacter sp. Leaf380]|uniref:transcription termination factor Rho n=1 Tax=Modestobacter sp. Leaf380 TaxID=1736356 RepID=UPI0006F8FAB1|nr:transcription termination factor Rho [Modestobacter sp. Leaf380]KQS73304.1 transcription termination factor Rho [Modestobacter sp. Leaf380]
MSETTSLVADGAADSTGSADTAGTEAAAGKRRRGTGLSSMLLPELQRLATELGIPGTGRMRKGDLVTAIEARQIGGNGNGTARTDATATAPQTTPDAPVAAPVAEATDAAAAPAAESAVTAPAVTAPPVADAPPVARRRRAASRPAGAPEAVADAPAQAETTSAPQVGGAPAADVAPVEAAPEAERPQAERPQAERPQADRPARSRNRSRDERQTTAAEPGTTAAADATADEHADERPAERTGRSRSRAREEQAGTERDDRDQADRSQGEGSQGERSQGERNQAERGQGERNQSDRSQSDRSQADRDQGDRGQHEGGPSERTRGDRPERPSRAERAERAAAERAERQERQDRDRQDRDRQDRDDRAERGDRQDRDRNDRDRNDRDRADRTDRDRGNDRGDRNDRGGNGPDDRGGRARTDRNGQGQPAGQAPRNDRDAGPDEDDDDFEGNGRRRGRRYRDRNRRGTTGTQGGRDRFDQGEPTVDEDDVLLPVAGILDVLDNYAFVRTSGYLTGPNDVYVSLSQVRRYGLRRGDAITGAVRQPREGERKDKYNALVRLDSVNGLDPEQAKTRPEFQKLVPLYPQDRLRMETESHLLTTRVLDLVMPIGKGQRALIVSPPKAGKTMVLQAIANAITTNNPECHLMVVLVDERPEEVTDMQRSVKGEVIASTFDRPATDHTTVAELSIERAKRLVEMGHDVVVLLDSITRLGRAYNLAAPASGRILSGGVDSTALYPPKRFLGAARNIENGGSLTIIASALVETGSTMDTVIFEEFKGTGNAEIKLDRRLADKRVFPAVDVNASSTRKEELLMSPDELAIVIKLRRVLAALEPQQALELLLGRLKKTRNNIEFLMQVQKTTLGNDKDL